MSKRILLTGATDGIGRLAAQDFARAGHSLVLHGRNQAKLAQTLADIRQQVPQARLEGQLADLASLAEVRRLAQILRTQAAGFDVIIHNAGLGIGAVEAGRQLSADGHELLLAVNYLAPVLLTRLLQPHLRDGVRLLNVASIGQRELDFDNLMLAQDFEPWRAYRQSKLALIMWSFDLARELAPRQIDVVALHPGTLLATQMVRLSHIEPQGTAQSGADVLTDLALREQIASGSYYDCHQPAQANPQAYDRAAREQLAAATDALLAPWSAPLD